MKNIIRKLKLPNRHVRLRNWPVRRLKLLSRRVRPKNWLVRKLRLQNRCVWLNLKSHQVKAGAKNELRDHCRHVCALQP